MSRNNKRNQKSKTSANSKKRPRPDQGIENKTSSISLPTPPPPPPPPPPKSLINLIRSNKNVLTYFSSLQENLEYDVKKWKLRAKRAEKKLEILQKQQKQSSNGSNDLKKNIATDLQTEEKRYSEVLLSNHDNNEEASVASSLSDTIYPVQLASKKPNVDSGVENGANRGKNTVTIAEAPPKNDTDQVDEEEKKNSDRLIDEFFDSDFESEEESDQENTSYAQNIHTSKNVSETKGISISHSGDQKHSHEPNLIHNNSANHGDSTNKESNTDEQTTIEEKREFELMKEAYRCFQTVGVSLVDIIEVENNYEEKNPQSEKQIESSGDSNMNCIQNDQKKILQSEPTKSLVHDADTLLEANHSSNIEDDQGTNGAPYIEKEKIVRPKSDEFVISEILQSMRALIKMKNPLLEGQNPDNDGVAKDEYEFKPFMGEDYVPCCFFHESSKKAAQSQENVPVFKKGRDRNGRLIKQENYFEHPASRGRRIVTRAISILDLLDDSLISIMYKKYQKIKLHESNQDEIQEGNTLEISKQHLFIGLKNRSKLVSKFITALDEEIRYIWASYDRSSRLNQHSSYCALQIQEQEKKSKAESEEENNQDSCEDSEDVSQSSTKYNNFDQYDAKAVLSYKRQNRLISLVERCMHASILANVYLYTRHDPFLLSQLIIDYVKSAVPCIGVEKYPLLPPPLSFVVLESLLHCGNMRIEFGEWFNEIILKMMNQGNTEQKGGSISSRGKNRFGKAFSLSMYLTFKIWKQRSQDSQNDRIRDTAVVEIAAYERLKLIFEEKKYRWFIDITQIEHGDNNFVHDWGDEVIRDGLDHLLMIPNVAMGESFSSHNKVKKQEPIYIESIISIELVLHSLGDENLLIHSCQKALKILGKCLVTNDDGNLTLPYTVAENALSIILICSRIHSNIRLYEWQSKVLLSKLTNEKLKEDHTEWRVNAIVASDFNMNFAFSTLQKLHELLLSNHDCQYNNELTDVQWKTISTLLQCTSILADGHFAHKLAKSLISKFNGEYKKIEELLNLNLNHVISKSIADIFYVANYPTVRVINLKRRGDRLQNFILNAQREQIFVVLGVTPLGTSPFHCTHVEEIEQEYEEKHKKYLTSCDGNDEAEAKIWGGYAYDGSGSQLDFENSVAQMFGNDFRYMKQKLVESHWRPHDLKAFDRFARNDDKLVRASATERACALSHISCWKGVEQTLLQFKLKKPQNSISESSKTTLLGDPVGFLHMFQISGFAEGKALLVENEEMSPSPVCVILEDDAVLCDRFSQRLAVLLDELPRDFHFCSLGYSRPKTAPMLDYSSNLGIPSCLWYLTGYIISLSGAQYLQKCLPVVGPVDSWIGLKMCSNWENKFGFMIGVGMHTKSKKEALSRKELVSVMKFRCFAALVPLCHQSVGGASSSSNMKNSEKSKGWRNRDTDIIYSGNS